MLFETIVVGSHGTGRAFGLLLGSAATTMLHEAPCPVLLARPSRDAAGFPQRIAVGVDGSPQAAGAEALATELARRSGAALRVVAALGGKAVDEHRVGRDAVRDERGPLAALEAESRVADLVVVGSRGLHGLAALGSVSERLAHRARCSVLVVRPRTRRWAAARDDAAVAGRPRGVYDTTRT